MQNNSIRLLAILLLTFFSFATLGAQVTIGSGIAPEKGALLQLKEKDAPDGEATAATGGLLLPRVVLTEKTELYPMFLRNPGEPNSGPNPDYSANKDALDKVHTGLIVYNLSEDGAKDLCRGLNQWDGQQWKCLQTQTDRVISAPVECSEIVIKGAYVEGKSVDVGNSMEITLDVKKAGIFVISATSANGYSFYQSGATLSTGKQTIRLSCSGKPVREGIDQLLFEGISLEAGCQPEVTVSSSPAVYAVNCSSIAIKGRYLKGTSLTSENLITMKVTVSSPGSYMIETPETQGISFHADGKFNNTGTFTVTLSGRGTPTINTDFPVTVLANTPQGNNSCIATIPVTLPSMTYAVIGRSNNTYTWDSGPRKSALANGQSFGPDGVVRIMAFTPLWITEDVNTARDYLDGGYNGKYPDVVLYFAYGAAPDEGLTTALENYIDKNGCVVYGAADGTSDQVNILMEGLFGTRPAIAQSGGAGDDDVYLISNMQDDPVINGPFGNLSGRHWGEDNGTTGSVIIKGLPENSVQVCSARSLSKTIQDPVYSIVWYNDSKNFLYFGDCPGSEISNNDIGGYPSNYDSRGIPLSKFYGPGNYRQYVYNSALELNAVAWAAKKAATSGINPH